nr:hypothetical protein GZ3D4_31 [uncultured archaeon GZfos3D4]
MQIFSSSAFSPSACYYLYVESFLRFHILFPGAVIDQFKGCSTCIYDLKLDDLYTSSTDEFRFLLRFRLKFYSIHLLHDLFIRRFCYFPRVARGRICFQGNDQDVSFLEFDFTTVVRCSEMHLTGTRTKHYKNRYEQYGEKHTADDISVFSHYSTPPLTLTHSR